MAKFAKFTHRHEAEVGADWLWWWLDSSGEAFGMLVQAKRLKRKRSRWDIDFNYGAGNQRRHLVATGLDLRVPPMYALYLGTSRWRNGAFCPAPVHTPDCESCEQITVCLSPAIVQTAAWGAADQEVSLALDAALPLEAIADPKVTIDRIFDTNLATADASLREFLTTPQIGARRIAQLVFERVTAIRVMGHSGPSGVLSERGTLPLFDSVPDDSGHFTRPYYPEILDGLRHEPPDYVWDVLADQSPPEAISSRVAGIAVFRC